MIFGPYGKNEMVGGNAFGAPLPQVSGDAGTPFADVVVAVGTALRLMLRIPVPVAAVLAAGKYIF
jgi:hypothetical protein